MTLINQENAWEVASRGHLSGKERRLLGLICTRYVEPVAEGLDSAYAELCGREPGEFSGLDADGKMAAYREIVLAREGADDAVGASFPVVGREGGAEATRVWSGTSEVGLPWPDCALVGRGAQQALQLSDFSMGSPLLDDLAFLEEVHLTRRKEALDTGNVESYLLRRVTDTVIFHARERDGAAKVDDDVARLGGEAAGEAIQDLPRSRKKRNDMRKMLAGALAPCLEGILRKKGPASPRQVGRVAKTIATKAFSAMDAPGWDAVARSAGEAMREAMLDGGYEEGASEAVASQVAPMFSALLADAYAAVRDSARGLFRDVEPDFTEAAEKLLAGYLKDVPVYDRARMRYASERLGGIEHDVAADVVETLEWAQRKLPEEVGEALAPAFGDVVMGSLLELSDKLAEARKSRIDADKVARRLERASRESEEGRRRYDHARRDCERLREDEEEALKALRKAVDAGGPAGMPYAKGDAAARRIRDMASGRLEAMGWDVEKAAMVADRAAGLATQMATDEKLATAYGGIVREALKDCANGKDWLDRGDRRRRSIESKFKRRGSKSLYKKAVTMTLARLRTCEGYQRLVALVAEGAEAVAAGRMERAVSEELGVADADVARLYLDEGVVRTLAVTAADRRCPVSLLDAHEILGLFGQVVASSDAGGDVPASTVIDVCHELWGLDEASHEEVAGAVGSAAGDAEALFGAALRALGIDPGSDAVAALTRRVSELARSEEAELFPLTCAEELRAASDAVAAGSGADLPLTMPAYRHGLSSVVCDYKKAARGVIGPMLEDPPDMGQGWYGPLREACAEVTAEWEARVTPDDVVPVGNGWHPEYSAALGAYVLASCFPTISPELALRHVVTGVPPTVPDAYYLPSWLAREGVPDPWVVVLPDGDGQDVAPGFPSALGHVLAVSRHPSGTPMLPASGRVILDRSGGIGLSVSGNAPTDVPRVIAGEVREIVLALADTVAEAVVGPDYRYRKRKDTRKDWGDAVALAVARSVLDSIDGRIVEGKLLGSGIANYKAPDDFYGDVLVSNIRKALKGIRDAARERVSGRMSAAAYDVLPDGKDRRPLAPPSRYAAYGVRYDHGGVHSSVRLA